jgi:arginine decarboxylase-like protein
MTDNGTFTETSYLLMTQGMAMTTQHGNLAIFTTKGMADQVAAANARLMNAQVLVQPVTIRPAGQAHPAGAPRVMNPDSAVLQQMEGYWQNMAALMLWKLARDGVELTKEDIESFPKGSVLLTHGHKESVEFKLVTQEVAETIVAHDRATHQGHA